MILCQNSRVVQGGPPRGEYRADHENRCTAPGKSQLVQWSTPISYSRLSRQEDPANKNCSVKYRNEIGVDSRTTSRLCRCRLVVSVVHPFCRRVDQVDHSSGEVTL